MTTSGVQRNGQLSHVLTIAEPESRISRHVVNLSNKEKGKQVLNHRPQPHARVWAWSLNTFEFQILVFNFLYFEFPVSYFKCYFSNFPSQIFYLEFSVSNFPSRVLYLELYISNFLFAIFFSIFVFFFDIYVSNT
jgi:hypothetical protein